MRFDQFLAAAAVTLLLAAPAAHAQEADHEHNHMAAGTAPADGTGSAVRDAYAAAGEKMHAAMGLPPGDDPDRLFAQQMIPHHEGAIEMARIQLEHGQDPELRKLAEEIIAAQEQEIAFLKAWLARQPAAE